MNIIWCEVTRRKIGINWEINIGLDHIWLDFLRTPDRLQHNYALKSNTLFVTRAPLVQSRRNMKNSLVVLVMEFPVGMREKENKTNRRVKNTWRIKEIVPLICSSTPATCWYLRALKKIHNFNPELQFSKSGYFLTTYIYAISLTPGKFSSGSFILSTTKAAEGGGGGRDITRMVGRSGGGGVKVPCRRCKFWSVPLLVRLLVSAIPNGTLPGISLTVVPFREATVARLRVEATQNFLTSWLRT